MVRKYITKALSDTREFFGWNRKTLTVPFLMAMGVFFHSKWALNRIDTNMKILMWLTYSVAPVAVFALLLFFWNLTCAPFRIEKLEHSKTKKKIPVSWNIDLAPQRPDEEQVFAHIINRKDMFTLREAALLLVDRKISGDMSHIASAQLIELQAMMRDNKLHRKDIIGSTERINQMSQRMDFHGTGELPMPSIRAKITRKQLYDLSIELNLPIPGLNP